jgi:hypothetical protein
MNAHVKNFVDLYDALSEQDRHDVAVELLRRSSGEGGLSDEAFSLVVEEAYATNLAAEEEAKNSQPSRSAR